MDSTVVGRKCKMRMNLWIDIVVDPGKISASIVSTYTFNSVKQYIVKNIQVKNKKKCKNAECHFITEFCLPVLK